VNAGRSSSAGIPQLTEVVGAIEHKVRRRFEVPRCCLAPLDLDGLRPIEKPARVKRGEAPRLPEYDPSNGNIPHFLPHLGDREIATAD
jgi:hypothetical protein